MFNTKDYSFISCQDGISYCKLIHNNDVEFVLQDLQIKYTNKQFTVHQFEDYK